MKSVKFFQIASIAFLFALSTANAETSKCTDLVKECYAYGQQERSNCFYTAANHPFCANSKLADLIVKRWSMAPTTNAPADNYAALVGPELVDRECVNNFDGTLSGMLVNGALTNDAIKSLNTQLDACRADQQIDLSRP